MDAGDEEKCRERERVGKRSRWTGTSWVVRNWRGEVLIHSRRVFKGFDSLLEARHIGLIWAIESMASHKLKKVCFEVEASELVGVVKRPLAWPAFRAYGTELAKLLSKIPDWKLDGIAREGKVTFQAGMLM
ncbi:hypothetical protein F2Q69_00037857 [Brassica cretica]|uniref:RNase H type-1 domain-containing protein n=1 Tax=Brassica cretica TaxID=69181 RepID=A0A8S9SHV7_BRACR|nr:hypothetical protein F2Q69_00037857 [Brassica cretica]